MAKFRPGDQVQLIADTDRIGVVLELGTLHGGLVQYYKVSWNVGNTSAVAQGDLRGFAGSTTPHEVLARGELGGHREFQRAITFERLNRDNPLTNNIASLNASRTRFFPYQFKPLLKFLDTANHRLLIADEVGLGKTIEAGLILTELRARQTLQRVLVVCPSNLREKWQREMLTRFGETFDILDAARMRSFLRLYETEPERAQLNGIISIESIRSRKLLEQMEGQLPTFDLVVVDEAHHMRNFGTQNRRAGEILSRGASAMVMLTATPIHLGNENLFSLLNLLDEGGFPDRQTGELRFQSNEPIVRAQASMARVPPQLAEVRAQLGMAATTIEINEHPAYAEALTRLASLESSSLDELERRRIHLALQRDLSDLNLIGHIFSRTRKREVHEHVVERRASVLQVRFSERERTFYDTVTEYVREESDRLDLGPGVQSWILQTPQRRMASCIPAMVDWYREKLHLTTEDLSEDETSAQLDSNEADSHKTAVAVGVRLRDIVAGWPQNEPDSKYTHLLRTFREFDGEQSSWKCMVFAFYKGTLRYLSRRLAQDGYSTLVLSGDVPIAERSAVIDQFRDDPTVQILLSSRVGGEGLDFQFCDTMFNYDLPWNPMEVEQRIGRLDRIGQESQVIRIFNFSVERTIEQKILERLYNRIGIFERSIGDLESILGEIVHELERDLLSKQLSPEDAEKRVESAAMVLEQRLEEIERLESASAQLVGVDEYFQAEVASIRDRRRYVTAVQLRQFVVDFLQHNCPRTRIAVSDDGEATLHVADDLRQFLSHSGVTSKDTPLLSSTGARGVATTFDANVAFNRPKIEFINVVHPLIKAIARKYKHTRIAPATHVALSRTEIISTGCYFFFVFKVVVQSVREHSVLEVVVLDEELRVACDGEDAETLLGEMVEYGEEPRGGRIEFDEDLIRAAHSTAESLFLDRLSKTRAEMERSNDAFLNRRIASVRAFHERKLTKQRELLALGEMRNADPRYLRLLNGTIVNIENELVLTIEALEGRRQVGVENHEVATGILEITHWA
jgi:superfamily II DNA or RNA helicase